jgi:membrane protease YdiL (CAAX protease family)
MNTSFLTPAPIVPLGRVRDRAIPVGAMGLLGVASLMLQPLPDVALQAIPTLADWPPLALRSLQLINPALLVVLAAVAGAWCAHRVGMRSLVAGTAERAGAAPVLLTSAIAGVALGALVGWVDHLWAPLLGIDWQRVMQSEAGQAPLLAVRLLYGGLAEEVMLRWGLMSVLALGLMRLLGGHRGWAMGAAIALSALLFAAAHLPALASVIEPGPGLVSRTLLLNGVAGIAYGLWFCRHHLEAAIALHACTHIGMVMVSRVLA